MQLSGIVGPERVKDVGHKTVQRVSLRRTDVRTDAECQERPLAPYVVAGMYGAVLHREELVSSTMRLTIVE